MDHAREQDVTQLVDARARLRENCVSHGRTERVSVADADGRPLAESVEARRDVPHYERAAMDGYAVRAADTVDAAEESPVELRVSDGAVGPGGARKVHTGSAMPDGADAVVMVEYVERAGDELTIYETVPLGDNVAPSGEDVRAGQHLFDPGHRLRPSDLALLRAAGVDEVAVAEVPRVSVVPTGEEVIDPGTEPAPGEVVETNGLLVAGLVRRWGGEPTCREVVTDDEAALRAALERDADHDLVVTTGGSSVGERDLLPDVVADAGELLVHGVAIKPGHPVGFGHVDGTVVLVLPGYPVSCLITAVQLLRPAVAWLAGAYPRPVPTTRARLAEPITSTRGKRSFARVSLEGRPTGDVPAVDGEPAGDLASARAVPGGAGVLSSVSFADGWVEIPESREEVPAGEVVAVQTWEL